MTSPIEAYGSPEVIVLSMNKLESVTQVPPSVIWLWIIVCSSPVEVLVNINI